MTEQIPETIGSCGKLPATLEVPNLHVRRTCSQSSTVGMYTNANMLGFAEDKSSELSDTSSHGRSPCYLLIFEDGASGQRLWTSL